jgi:hypothetical protein
MLALSFKKGSTYRHQESIQVILLLAWPVLQVMIRSVNLCYCRVLFWQRRNDGGLVAIAAKCESALEGWDCGRVFRIEEVAVSN